MNINMRIHLMTRQRDKQNTPRFLKEIGTVVQSIGFLFSYYHINGPIRYDRDGANCILARKFDVASPRWKGNSLALGRGAWRAVQCGFHGKDARNHSHRYAHAHAHRVTRFRFVTIL